MIALHRSTTDASSENGDPLRHGKWKAELLMSVFHDDYARNVDLQDEIGLAQRRIWLKKDGLFLVAEEFGEHKGTLPQPDVKTLPDERICM